MIEARLSERELAQFHDKGWIVPRWELPQDLIAEMRDEYAALLARNSDIKSDIILAPHQTKGGSMGVIGSEKWLNFATHPGLVFDRPPAHRRRHHPVGHHDLRQAGAQRQGNPVAPGRRILSDQAVAGSDDLDRLGRRDAGERADALHPRLAQGQKLHSHSWVEGDDKTINLVCDRQHYDKSTAESLILKAGQASFHDVYMIHGSQANHTDRRRAAFIVRLMPATSIYDHALGAEIGKRHPAQGYGVRPLYLVSGRDRAGNNFSIGHE